MCACVRTRYLLFQFVINQYTCYEAKQCNFRIYVWRISEHVPILILHFAFAMAMALAMDLNADVAIAAYPFQLYKFIVERWFFIVIAVLLL